MTRNASMTMEQYVGDPTYTNYQQMSQWQRFRHLRMMQQRKRGLTVWPLFVFYPFGSWRRFGFDSSQTCEFFYLGPFWIEWGWE